MKIQIDIGTPVCAYGTKRDDELMFGVVFDIVIEHGRAYYKIAWDQWSECAHLWSYSEVAHWVNWYRQELKLICQNL